MNIITGLQVFALVAIIVAMAIVLNVMEARRRINSLPKPEDDDQAKEDVLYRRRMIYEADQYNEACSMEPFCGEGRKKRERKQESGPSAYDPYAPITFAAVADSEPSLQSSRSSYSGHGGSFDGGGASGDWGGSSSGSSSSSDCSSSSSDSSSSSCSSSD